jgi:hypothetical protein
MQWLLRGVAVADPAVKKASDHRRPPRPAEDRSRAQGAHPDRTRQDGRVLRN